MDLLWSIDFFETSILQIQNRKIIFLCIVFDFLIDVFDLKNNRNFCAELNLLCLCYFFKVIARSAAEPVAKCVAAPHQADFHRNVLSHGGLN